MNVLITLNVENMVQPITSKTAKLAIYNSDLGKMHLLDGDDIQTGESSILNVVNSEDINAILSYDYNRMGLTFFRVNNVTPYLAQKYCDVERNIELLMNSKLEEATVSNISKNAACSSDACSSCNSVCN